MLSGVNIIQMYGCMAAVRLSDVYSIAHGVHIESFPTAVMDVWPL